MIGDQDDLNIIWEVDPSYKISSPYNEFDVIFSDLLTDTYYYTCKSDVLKWTYLINFVGNFRCKTFTLTIKKGDITIRIVENINAVINLTRMMELKEKIRNYIGVHEN